MKEKATGNRLFLSGILLAAGLSRRMGEINKLLLEVDGAPMVVHAANRLMEADVDERIVVLGHEAGRVREALNGFDVRFVENPGYPQGMTSSIQAGVRAVSPASVGYLIALSDMPRLSPSTPAGVLAAFRAAEALRPGAIVIPVYQGRRGHPVVFSVVYREEILAHDEPEGCRGIVKRHAHRVIEMPTEDEGAVWDVDTMEAGQKEKGKRKSGC